MGKIRVAIIGVGNCASSLVQGVEYYKNAKDKDFIPGLMHVNLGGYRIKDIEFSAAFDIEFSLSMDSRISAPPLPIKGLPWYSIQTLQESLWLLLVNISSIVMC